MTFFAGFPCTKTVSFPRNSPTFLPRPAVSRNDFTSKAGSFEFAFGGLRRGLLDTRRTAEVTIDDDIMGSEDRTDRPGSECAVLNSFRFLQEIPYSRVLSRRLL